jgi:4-aminobutyrate aminotransferase/(S)-3-amino-2-methylpropionate transaminase
MVTPYLGYIEVCEALNRLTPGEHAKKSALFNSGAEAVENAVKIARIATGRDAVVVFEHGYHGRTNLTMAMTAKDKPYKHGFGPFAGEVYRMPLAYPFRWPTGPENCGPEALAAVTSKIDKELGADQVAAIVIEPIQGEGGFIVPGEGFIAGLAAYARANGIVFVADEVQTGFARTGAMFACEHEGVIPDLIVTAKALGGGLPLAAVTGRAELMDAPHVGGLGGTYGGNPVACAAALGAIATIEEENLVEAARHIGEIMLPFLRDLQARYPAIGDVRGRGAMTAVELVSPGTKEPAPEATSKVAALCAAEGVLVLTAGTYSNVLRFLPPLVIGEDLLRDALGVIEKAFASLD